MESFKKYQVLGTLNGKLVKEDCSTTSEVNQTIAKLKKKDGFVLKAILTRYNKPTKKKK